MFKIPISAIFVILFFSLPTKAISADWYMYFKDIKKCKIHNKYSSPAKYIEAMKILEHKYSVDDKKINGNIIKVTISDLSTYVSVTYYKTKDICEDEVTIKNKKDLDEYNKYN